MRNEAAGGRMEQEVTKSDSRKQGKRYAAYAGRFADAWKKGILQKKTGGKRA